MESLAPLAVYAFVSSITPGPNNMMLTTSGLRFGFVRTVPHILGVSTGFCTLLALCAAGVGQLVGAAPALQLALKLVGSAYLLHMAWRLRVLSAAPPDGELGAPMSFAAAWLFQFVNPKGWLMAVTSAAAFLPPIHPAALSIAAYCVVFVGVGLPCLCIWAGAGAALRERLLKPNWQRGVGLGMAALTLYAAASVW